MLKLNFYKKVQSRTSQKLFDSLLPRAFKILCRQKILKKNETLSLDFTLVGNAEITKLNKEYHHKNRPTDVISLSFFEKGMTDWYAGEIFISLPYARQQAKKIGQPLAEELRFLFVHGLLHLFGYDHKKPAEEKKMLRLTYRILGRD